MQDVAQSLERAAQTTRTRILVTEPLAESGLALLREEAEVETRYKIPHEELLRIIPDYDALIVRSGTKVTRDVIEAGERLRVIGRAGTGVDNIDLRAATERGIIVVNAPTANCIAAAEHAIALMFAVARNIPQAHQAMQRGEWDRHRFVGTAVVDKVMGIVGFGRVGGEVARRARGLGMRVLAYDPYLPRERAEALGVELVSLEALLATADFVSLHVPLVESTRHLIDAERLASMKPTAYLINVARGGVVDEDALVQALDEGRLAGAALDVFAEEPPRDTRLATHPKIVTTPHLGASTTEAQIGVATEVARAVLMSLRGDLAPTTVNAPMVAPETLRELRPYVDLAERLARLAVQLVAHGPSEVRIVYRGAFDDDTRLLRAAVVKGLLEPIGEYHVNFVNADLLAQQRGLRIVEERHTATDGLSETIEVRLTNGDDHSVQGAVLRGTPRVIRIGDFWIDLELQGCMLLCRNQDRPGMIGKVGAILGEADVNISFMQVGRDQPRGQAVMAIGLDEEPSGEVLAKIQAIDGIEDVRLVEI
nr:phosphoglycerate dehydrogenase [Ardenticatena sp.]